MRPAATIAVVGIAAIVAAGVLLADPGPSGTTVESAGPSIASPLAPRSTAVLAPVGDEVVLFASDVRGDYDIYVLEPRSLRPRRLTRTVRNERQPVLSPDGRLVAYVVGDEPSRDIWLMDVDGGRQRPVIAHAADDNDPAWSPDGRSLAFASTRGGLSVDIYEIRDRGDGFRDRDARNLTRRAATEHLPDWAPTGRRLVISSSHFSGDRDLVMIDPDDREVLLRRTAGPGFDLSSSYAPDGQDIAFDRRAFCPTCWLNRGPADLYLLDTKSGRERQVTTSADRDELHPDWAPDGRAIAFSAGRTGSMELFAMTPDGRRRRRLLSGWSDAIQPAWGVVERASDEPIAATPAS